MSPAYSVRLVAVALVALAFAPIAAADASVEVTIHETMGGPAVATVTTCSYYVRGAGLLGESGTILVKDGATVVASIPFTASMNPDGLWDAVAGPVPVSAPALGLQATFTYADPALPALPVGPAFDLAPTGPCAAYTACAVDGFRPPIGTPGHTLPDGTQKFRHGQTIPVKLRVTCSGALPPAAPRLLVAGAANLAVEQPATAAGSSAEANQMTARGGHWHFNLDTKPLPSGLVRLRVDVGDGATHETWLYLR